MSKSGANSGRPEEIVGAGARLSGLPDLAAILQGIAGAALGADRATCHAHSVEDQVVTAVYTTEARPEHRALERNVGKVATRLPICRLQVARADPLVTIEDVANDPTVPLAVVLCIGSGAVLGVRLEHPSIQTAGGLAMLGTLVWIYRRPRRFSSAERQMRSGWRAWRRSPPSKLGYHRALLGEVPGRVSACRMRPTTTGRSPGNRPGRPG